ncbi:MAG: VWA domain-containing protein, partial [Pyrinomonadaceae bacterium]
MRKFVPLLLFILFALSTHAQEPTRTPSSDVVKISTNLIQLDVTVTDKKGKIITDLRRDEIEIFENGKKQDISNFSFVSGVSEKPEKAPKKEKRSEAVPAPDVTSRPRPENIRRTIAIVIDDMSLGFASSYWVKTELRKYVNEQIQEGDLVGIVRTGGGVGVLQQLTTNKRQLMAAVENSRFNLSGSGRIGAVDAIRPWATDGEQGGKEFRDDMTVNASLTSLYQIIEGMRDLPGRKSIVMLTDGFVLFPRTLNGLSTSNRPVRNAILNSVRRLTDLANRNSVVIYTIEAKGMTAPGLFAEDNTFDMSSDQVSAMVATRDRSGGSEQEGPTYLSRETGGFSIINSNNINKGIDKILDDQSYYLIGYQPDDETFDPKSSRYNKLVVRVNRKDTRVRYRSGFFGVENSEMAKPTLTATESIVKALTSPFAVNDILLNLNALFVAG